MKVKQTAVGLIINYFKFKMKNVFTESFPCNLQNGMERNTFLRDIVSISGTTKTVNLEITKRKLIF